MYDEIWIGNMTQVESTNICIYEAVELILVTPTDVALVSVPHLHRKDSKTPIIAGSPLFKMMIV